MPERGWKMSTVPVVWATFAIFSSIRDPNDFLSRLVTMDETWLYHYDPETRQSNNQWSDGIAAHPAPSQKNSECKIRWKSSSLNFLGSRRHPPHGLSSKGLNSHCWVLLISTGAIEGHFEGKTPTQREGHQGGLVLARQFPGSPGTFNPEEIGLTELPMSWSPTLLSGSSPVGLPPVPWTEKTVEMSQFFVRRGVHCCREDLVGRKNLWIFLSDSQTLDQRTKKYIELRGKHVE